MVLIGKERLLSLRCAEAPKGTGHLNSTETVKIAKVLEVDATQLCQVTDVGITLLIESGDVGFTPGTSVYGNFHFAGGGPREQ